ncbi:tyrosine-type recombinase/integrase [Arachidicoccus ginsenosidivorans]|jgi:integrase|uniref:Tyrosine-type recombinase/integrase n=1 Tax=Arachidicoccus ginsenosidivorans TaxID=496057 RepID=A0A5B8VUM6_9BACT|nr:tyrosine-type recombinase/integrase [Arachidicoccus ginsenosidivorans]QEC73858.1 tyrosine-type recombinase/integrase [Arachidicoccus ginsenosidivorans]
MKNIELHSIYSDLICKYLQYREQCGVKFIENEFRFYRILDEFITKNEIKSIIFTKEHAALWRVPLNGESETSRYKRINFTKKFFEYLFFNGYNVFQFRDIKAPKSNFTPHIYSEDEIKRYFKAVDSYRCSIHRKNCIQFPVLFRILYCCGTRITETLMIRKKDVDLVSGIIKLSETKNAKERYVVMSDSLLRLMKEFADKIFYDLPENGYIFRNYRGTYFSSDWINEVHVKMLHQANIPYMSNGRGPRLQDWRHSFAINSFRQMIDKGLDMYVALPILSTYLGHKTIMATEHYLRLAVSMYPYLEKKFDRTLNEIFGGEKP